jgi:uncharacterized protein YfeS
MSRHSNFQEFQPPELFSHQTLELTFRLLRYNNPPLALAIKRALDEVALAPPEALFAITDEVHLNSDLIKSLTATNTIKIVAALNDTARTALQQNNLPTSHMKILSNLIEDWAKFAEWILAHTTSDRAAFLKN